MKIREFSPQDAEEKREVHRKSIKEIAGEDLSDEQIEAWANIEETGEEKLPEEKERWVAEEDGKVIGFGDYSHETGEITGLYVLPEHTRNGVASELLKRIEENAQQRGLEKLWCNSSEAARKLYSEKGYELKESFKYDLGGVEMPAYRMEKRLQK